MTDSNAFTNQHPYTGNKAKIYLFTASKIYEVQLSTQLLFCFGVLLLDGD